MLLSYWLWTSGITAALTLLHAAFYSEPDTMMNYVKLIVTAPYLWAVVAFLALFKPDMLQEMIDSDS
jgi:hypothetical protein